MLEIKLYNLDRSYANHLESVDNNLSIVSSEGKKNRPFVGVLISVDNKFYIAPLTSPKEKHKKMKNNIDFIKIDSGNLGAINLNSMVPVNDSVCTKIDIDSINDTKYKTLLNNQIIWLRKNKNTIIDKADSLYRKYKTNTLPSNIKSRCCNFLELEKQLDNWNNRYNGYSR